MKKLIISLLLLFSFNVFYAQFGKGKAKNVKKIMSRSLIVIKEYPLPKVVKKLEKKGKIKELERYRSKIENYNKELKEAVLQWWKFTDKIEFKDWDEVLKMKRDGQKNYAVLFCASYISNRDLSQVNMSKGLLWKPEYDKDVFEFKGIRINIQLLEKFGSTRPFVQVSLPNVFPTTTEINMGVSAIQRAIEFIVSKKDYDDFFLSKEKGAVLAQRTLLFYKRDTRFKRVKATYEKIQEAYPFTIQEVTAEEMAKAITDRDTSQALLHFSPIPSGAGLTWIIDAGTGDVLFFGSIDYSRRKSKSKGSFFDFTNILNALEN